MEMVEAMLETCVGLGVDWTVSRGALRLLTSTPSNHTSIPLSLTTYLLAATLAGWGLGPGATQVTLTSGGSTVMYLNVVS